jgi:hypothetical protein
MLTPPNEVYPASGRATSVVDFNLGHPGTAERSERERVGWCGAASLEGYYPGNVALIVDPGGAKGPSW